MTELESRKSKPVRAHMGVSQRGRTHGICERLGRAGARGSESVRMMQRVFESHGYAVEQTCQVGTGAHEESRCGMRMEVVLAAMGREGVKLARARA